MRVHLRRFIFRLRVASLLLAAAAPGLADQPNILPQNCATDDPHTEVTGGYLTADMTDWVMGRIQNQPPAPWFAHVA